MRLLMVSGDRQIVIGEKGPFYTLHEEFSRHFERIDVIVPRPTKPVLVRTLFERVHFHPADCSRAGMPAFIDRKGGELIAAHGHGLIVSHDYGWFYNGFGSARLSRHTGVGYLSEIHHVPGVPVAADLRERLDRTVARRYVRWARHRARAFRVVNAGEMAPLLESWGVPREQIVVWPSLYIDHQVFRPPDAPVVPEQDVLFVGRMVANKGLFSIVEALHGLAREGNALRVLFVGQGPLEARVREAARVLGERARFVRWVPSAADLAEIYRRSRVLVCASTCEGGPRVTVEAMACGTPVVSTPVGMMRELLLDGVNGFSAGFDVDSLRAAIARAVGAKPAGDEPARRAMSEQARQATLRFEKRRTIQAYAEGIHALGRR